MNYLNQDFTGERALFQARNATIEKCHFLDGESPLKESKNLTIFETIFSWKYPLWYSKNIVCRESVFEEMARAGIWYTKDSLFQKCHFIGPKEFRACKNVTIEECEFANGIETLWWCDGMKLKNVVSTGDYFGLRSKNIEADNLTLHGNYGFDGCKHLRIRHSELKTKDAFWNCDDVVVEDSYIEGEYFGWNSKNVTLIRCTIKSHQGFCYMKNIRLIDCKIIDSDLTFEYCSNIDATVHSRIGSIKNPISGIIRCQGYNELIQDDCDPKKTKIEVI